LGALRFTLFNYAFAAANGGSFVVRVEDTDGSRGDPGLLDELYATLAWVGVDYHEGGAKGGAYGPYRQSQRLELYAEHARALVNAGVAYCCFCPPERLARLREIAPRRGYDRQCAGLDRTEVEDRAESGEPHVVRMRVPRGETRTVRDEVYGELTMPSDALDDQVLLKSDGFPTYHFASVVDDHLMRMTHVLRADVWLVSTPKHLLLYEWFGWQPPRFAHVPAMRGGMWSTTVQELRWRGVPADAVVNFVASLGWRGRGLSEVFTLPQLISAFALEGIKRSCGVADSARLAWLSTRHLRLRPVERAAEEVVPYLRAAGLPVGTAERRRRALTLCLPRCGSYAEVADGFGYLFAAPALSSADRAELASTEEPLAAVFGTDASGDFSPAALEEHFRAFAARRGLKLRHLLDSVRLAVCGVRSGPDVFEVMAFLGRTECASRISVAATRGGSGGP
jgi:glutamyl-tRNA synthetase